MSCNTSALHGWFSLEKQETEFKTLFRQLPRNWHLGCNSFALHIYGHHWENNWHLQVQKPSSGQYPEVGIWTEIALPYLYHFQLKKVTLESSKSYSEHYQEASSWAATHLTTVNDDIDEFQILFWPLPRSWHLSQSSFSLHVWFQLKKNLHWQVPNPHLTNTHELEFELQLIFPTYMNLIRKIDIGEFQIFFWPIPRSWHLICKSFALCVWFWFKKVTLVSSKSSTDQYLEASIWAAIPLPYVYDSLWKKVTLVSSKSSSDQIPSCWHLSCISFALSVWFWL